MPTDFDEGTYSAQEICLADLIECRFSYSDGKTWQENWDENKAVPPRMIKLIFKFKEENKEREFLVNIPISQ